ncbi:DnaJ C-terminal domain-containing protein [Propionivibrio sp.]|mgnify:CR=1 FL=1|uniref:DnaJ C-terminal domain-containing protein n=1 Tax=Propionivibrio sp. TaxID=2212460 RepID=UPI0025DE572A|nr:DnaJ C-terminal domain-containing protein [Propionivibrio sp.]
MFSHIGGTRRRAGGPQAKGQDHHARIVIDLDDAWNGSTRQISLRVPQAGPDGRLTLVTRTLKVKIPQGVREGQLIRLGGLGAPGFSGGSAGDLYLEVHFHPHPRFRVEGRDLHLALPVAPWEAALGATIAIALPAGHQVKVRIPEGAQSGHKLKVRGKGIPGDSSGDLYLNIEVVLPDASHPQARQIYETMQRELAFNPRAEWENTR